MGRLSGKQIVVTGGNSGIGLASARAFVAEGANVIISGRNQESLDAAVKELGSAAAGVRADVSKRADVEALFQAAKERFGAVDAVFANAGIALPGPLDQVGEDHFDRQFDINVKGAWLTAQAALPVLKEGSTIVYNTSAVDVKGMAGMSIYAATKAALRSLVRSFAAELAPKGIRVNAVAPGPIATPIYDRMGLPSEQKDAFGQQIEQMTPLGRFGTPEDIAHAAVYLVSDESIYMTGAELAVDGGFAQV